jgi:photosystem II stability/assembly factor-like uncharacterized protein
MNSLKPSDTLWSYAANDSLRQKKIFRKFDPRKNNNFLAFSVYASGNDTIWCGTAGGINKSTDGGASWVRYNHQNQASPILGNWVIAIREQRFKNISRLWTTNWKAEDPNEDFGVSYTGDGGRTWNNLLAGVRAYYFAFKDSVAYIATDEGVYRTADGGLSMVKTSSFFDPESHQAIISPKAYTVEVIGDTVYVGTSDGIASTVDNASTQFGSSWKILRTYQQLSSTEETYAYPNPFSPGSEVTRIHYGMKGQSGSQRPSGGVRIDIFDFGMNRVRTLISDAGRNIGREYDEIWDGRRDDGRTVANGTYFYRIKIDDGDPIFGKILVLQ